MDKTSIGDRMKKYYEGRAKSSLTRRMPVIIRVDGKAFHTLTKKMDKPFDKKLIQCMSFTAVKVASNMQGCKFGYQQSDEISFLLTDYDKLTTEAWFDYEIQKMASIAASLATGYFNAYANEIDLDCDRIANFDARCFNIPKEEVTNYFIWRQQDATRNSIQMVGQANFSHKELQNKSCDQIQEMLWKEKKINWDNLPTSYKRGIAIYKRMQKSGELNGFAIDGEAPIFTQDRDYIEKWVESTE